MTTPDISLDRQVLGLALNGPRDLRDVRHVNAQWFNDPVCAAVWPVVQRLDSEGTPLDVQVLAGNVGDVDPMWRGRVTLEWLFDCWHSAPIGHLGIQYADQLKEQYWRRTMADGLIRGQQLLDGNASVREARLEVMSTLEGIDLDSAADPDMDQIIDEALDTYDRPSRFTPTPWDGLNRIVRGWRPGGLYVIGARPGVGKSLMLLQAAVSLTGHGPVLLENLEMGPGEVMTRFISSAANVPLGKLNGRRPDGSGGPSEWDWQAIREAAGRARQMPLVIRGQRTRTPLDVREHARAAAGSGKLAGIVVDYLQLLHAARRTDSRVQEVSEITRELKLMAGEFDCPVIIASQLNRESQKDSTAGPNLMALRESGSIEQDADVVLLVTEDKASQGTSDEVCIDAAVLKNRQGPQGKFPLVRAGKTATIQDDPTRNPR